MVSREAGVTPAVGETGGRLAGGDGDRHLRSQSPFRAVRAVLVVLLVLSLAVPALASGSRDVLWEVVTTCLDPSTHDYCNTCRSPRADSSCAEERFCRETTEVWAESDAYVALRDRKMCGCPKGFVHGLVLPKARVTGVEDPKRPDGIWNFAWEVAQKRIGSEPATALAVNPRGNRSQDQLHIHVVRLQAGARSRFKPERTAHVQSLDEVWGSAAWTAAANDFKDYGVLVTGDADGGYLVLVEPESPEKLHVQERCK